MCGMTQRATFEWAASSSTRRTSRRRQSSRSSRTRRARRSSSASGGAPSPRPLRHGYRDLYGNGCQRVTLPVGRSTLRFDALVVGPRRHRGGRPRRPGDARRRAARRRARLHAAQPLRPARRPRRRGVEAVRRRDARLPPGRRDRRPRQRPRHVHPRQQHGPDDGRRRLRGAGRRVPRLRPRRPQLLPCAQHPGALRLRLPAGDRGRADGRADGLRRVDRGVPRRHVVHVRPAQQRGAQGPRADRSWARCSRRGDGDDVRWARARTDGGLGARGRGSPRSRSERA